MSKTICRIKSCDGESFARRYCAAHYRRIMKLGHSDSKRPIKRRNFGVVTINEPEYRAWRSMLQRCLNKKDRGYKWYGARGIKVCKRWLKSENFLADMGKRPSKKHSLERINNNKGYSPYNCKWATWKEQLNNRRPSSQWTFKNG